MLDALPDRDALHSALDIVRAQQIPPTPTIRWPVLEQRLGATTTEPSRFVVRLTFQNDGAGWKSLNPDCADEACLGTAPATLPPSTTWNIVHAGAVKGSVTATTPAK